MTRDALEADMELLRCEGHTVDVHEEQKRFLVVVRNHPLPPRRFNKATTDILMQVPKPYPRGKMDMFWTDQDLLLANGRPAAATLHMEPFLGRPWRRFSRHTKHPWRPGFDNLRTHWSMVQQCLLEAAP